MAADKGANDRAGSHDKQEHPISAQDRKALVAAIAREVDSGGLIWRWNSGASSFGYPKKNSMTAPGTPRSSIPTKHLGTAMPTKSENCQAKTSVQSWPACQPSAFLN